MCESLSVQDSAGGGVLAGIHSSVKGVWREIQKVCPTFCSWHIVLFKGALSATPDPQLTVPPESLLS